MEKLMSPSHLNKDLVNEEKAKELLEAQAHLYNHIFNFINSMSLKCAIELDIPDIIQNHGKPMTLSQLIAALPIHQKKSSCVYRLMRILVHSGFFDLRKAGETDQEDGYVLTDTSKLLLKDNPLSAAPFLVAMLDPFMTKPWDFLGTWFRNDDPTPFYTSTGMSLWDFGVHHPELGDLFNDAMASDARLISSVMIAKDKKVFEGLESLVDVGGGTGTVAKTIAKAFPQIECTVFDLPHVIADVIAGEQGNDHLKFVGGDMFDVVPPADAVLLKWILHDWSDEESVKLLEKCKEAITSKCNKKGNKVIIIDMVVENQKVKNDKSYETQLFFDMITMVLYPGRERNEKEWAKLFQDVGFSNYKITPNLGLPSLIEVYP